MNRKIKKTEIILIMCFSILYVLLFSYSTSPLFPYYYGGDSAQFLTIGKAWYLGKVPYIDLFDHKGPFIFWIDMLGFRLANGQKYGVAFVQCFFLFFSLMAFYKISQLFYENKAYGFMVLIITLIIMKRNYGDGNTVEEYCIPFISWSFYEIIKYWKGRKNNSEHCIIAGGLYGVTFGVCLTTRITNFIPICAGILFIFIYLLYKKKYINILKNIISGLMGSGIVIIPFVIYFALKRGLYECIYGTLLYNFEYAEGRKSWLLTASGNDVKLYFLLYILSLSTFIISIIALMKKKYDEAGLYFLTGLLEQAMYLSGDAFPQYPLVCVVQIPIMINYLTDLLLDKKWEEMLLGLISVNILSLLLINDGSLMIESFDYRKNFKSKTDREWEKMLDEIPSNEKNSFVAYGGNEFKELYLLEDLMPCYKYFVIQEWQGNLSPETKIAIYDTFASKQAKWILTDNETNIIQDVLKNNYVQVDVAENYCLYTLKE